MQRPELPGAGISGPRAGISAPGRNFRPSEKLQNEQNEHGHIFCIRTPFSMILGSLDSQRKALQDHAEKHHCPLWYYKTKWGEFKSSFSQTEKPFLLQLKSERSKTNFVGQRTTKATFVNGKQAKEILQRDERNKSSARMNRQNLQHRNRKRRRKCKPFSVNLALSWQARQAPRPHHDMRQIRTNKDDCMDVKVWALHERYDHDTWSRAPLDSTAIYPITRSLN